MDEIMMGACGINCGNCDIKLATNDTAIAERLAKGFSEKGIIPDATPDMFRCDGCLGDRFTHWSANCWILQCCVDDKKLDNCSQCDSFTCKELEDWAEGNERYQKALDRLYSL